MKEMGFVGVGEAIVGRIFVLGGEEGSVCVKMKRNYERSWPQNEGKVLLLETGKVLLTFD